MEINTLVILLLLLLVVAWPCGTRRMILKLTAEIALAKKATTAGDRLKEERVVIKVQHQHQHH